MSLADILSSMESKDVFGFFRSHAGIIRVPYSAPISKIGVQPSQTLVSPSDAVAKSAIKLQLLILSITLPQEGRVFVSLHENRSFFFLSLFFSAPYLG